MTFYFNFNKWLYFTIKPNAVFMPFKTKKLDWKCKYINKKFVKYIAFAFITKQFSLIPVWSIHISGLPNMKCCCWPKLCRFINLMTCVFAAFKKIKSVLNYFTKKTTFGNDKIILTKIAVPIYFKLPSHNNLNITKN